MDLLFLKEKEKQLSKNNKTTNLEENNSENKLLYSNSNNNIYNKDTNNLNKNKLKIYDDIVISKLNINSRDSFIKKNNLNEENYINDKKYNSKRTSADNKAYVGFNKKQSKLVLFDRNKNYALLNYNNLNNDKKLNSNYKNEIIDLKEVMNNKNYNNSKNINNINNHSKKISSISSMENILKQKNILKSNSDDSNNCILLDNKKKDLNKRNINKIDFQLSIKDYINKSNDEVNSNILNKKIININQLKNNNNKKQINKNILNTISNINNINNKIKINSLSNKEKAYYLLTQSNILSLRQRIIFSQATEKIRSLISIKDILKMNKLFIKEKIEKLEQKISEYNSIIETHFIPSKTAIISLNLIKKEDEDNFKNYCNNNIKEIEKDYYYKYIELLYILIEDNINEKILNKINVNILYDILNKKGFKTCKDFLYEIFITQKSEKIFDEQRMNKYNKLFDKLPDFIKNQGDMKNDKFIKFTYFLMHEIYNYWNKLKESLNLKNKTQSYIEHLKYKFLDL